ncbi:hypothetical protein [Streptomyces griseosporeus]|uniref:hypothetical protein n=1 Tax=Streptomyces griseosporeus TaxID=1910 RepID=UPI0036FDAC39
MTHTSRTKAPQPAELPHHQAILDGTDWPSLATVRGTGESLPAALAGLTDPDPVIRAATVEDALGQVTHQNSLYEATVPVALYVAAILDHPAVTAGELDRTVTAPPRRPTLVRLLDWLGDTARDADDECLSLGERHFGEAFLDEYDPMRSFRDVRPALFAAVHALLDHADADVRDAALVAAIPLAEHPALAAHRSELAGHALRLLATSAHRNHRDRVLHAFRVWGHDTAGPEHADDLAAPEHRGRLRAARGLWEGGCSEDPPF